MDETQTISILFIIFFVIIIFILAFFLDARKKRRKKQSRSRHHNSFLIPKGLSINNGQFMDLRKSLNQRWDEEILGVYIIWNKTKNKYYVGQSKDIFKRVFKQHFFNGEPRNWLFFRDWENQDEFYWKYIEYSSKEELNNAERYHIEAYNSYKNGYNSTIGNS